jgi:CheY-like chemotaxis protein
VAEDTLKELLKGIRITIAENGEAAIQQLKEQDFDLILMDIQMPAMNGVDATRYIRTKMPEGKKDVRIIAMTANVLQEDVQRYLKAGMNAYISKPFQTDELLLKMDMVLQGREEAAKAPEAGKQVDNLILPDVVTDMHFLMQFTGGKIEKQEKYVKMFLENGPKLLQKIVDSLSRNDYESIRIAAHSMKPQLSYMGVQEEVSNILLIEQTAASKAHHDRLPILVRHLQKVCARAFSELKNKLSV